MLFLKVGNDKEWLLTGSVTQLVLAIISKDTRTPLERWVFDIFLVDPAPEGSEARYDCYSCYGWMCIKINGEQPTNETGVRDTIRNSGYLEANHLYGDISASHP